MLTNWTFSKPTKEGYYFYRPDFDLNRPTIVYIDEDIYVLNIGDETPSHISTYEGLWLGPISIPELNL